MHEFQLPASPCVAKASLAHGARGSLLQHNIRGPIAHYFLASSSSILHGESRTGPHPEGQQLSRGAVVLRVRCRHMSVAGHVQPSAELRISVVVPGELGAEIVSVCTDLCHRGVVLVASVVESVAIQWRPVRKGLNALGTLGAAETLGTLGAAEALGTLGAAVALGGTRAATLASSRADGLGHALVEVSQIAVPDSSTRRLLTPGSGI